MKKFFLLSLSLLFTACVSAKVTKLSSTAYPPVAPEEVTVYLSEDEIESDYEKVGLIHLSGDYEWTDENQMLNKAKAAQIGANGLIFGAMKEPTTGQKVWNALLGTSADRKSQMVAVRVFKKYMKKETP